MLEFVRWYGHAVDGDRLTQVATELQGRVTDRLDPGHPTLGFIASDWYEASTIHRLLDGLTEGMGERDRRELAERGATAVMNATLRGVFRTLFRMMTTPERYARFAPLLWKVYYDSGQFVVVMPDRTSAVCTVSGWRTHHPFICELNRGAARAIYEALGCRAVRVERTDCVERGGETCRFVSTWMK